MEKGKYNIIIFNFNYIIQGDQIEKSQMFIQSINCKTVRQK